MALQVNEGSLSVNGFNEKHPEYYFELVLRTNFLPEQTYIKERFWHIANKTANKPICKRDGCNSPTHWRRANSAHTEWCSIHCLRKDQWKIRKLKDKTLDFEV